MKLRAEPGCVCWPTHLLLLHHRSVLPLQALRHHHRLPGRLRVPLELVGLELLLAVDPARVRLLDLNRKSDGWSEIIWGKRSTKCRRGV